MNELFSVSDVGATGSVRKHASGNDELVVVDTRLVSLPVGVRILENENSITGLLIDVELGISLAARHPEASLPVEIDLCRVRLSGL